MLAAALGAQYSQRVLLLRPPKFNDHRTDSEILREKKIHPLVAGGLYRVESEAGRAALGVCCCSTRLRPLRVFLMNYVSEGVQHVRLERGGEGLMRLKKHSVQILHT